MKSFKKYLSTLLLSFLTFLVTGCFLAAVTTGGGTVEYINGSYSMNLPGDVIQVRKAAFQVLCNGKYNTSIDNCSDDTSGNYLMLSKTPIENDSIVIEGADKHNDNSFTISIRKEAKDISKVSIKYGILGDQAESSTLMDQIQERLK